MKIRKKTADKFFYNQYRYRVSVQSYVVLKPETCRNAIRSRDTKLVRDKSRWGAVTVYFNDISLVDDLTEMHDLLAFNLTECIIDT